MGKLHLVFLFFSLFFTQVMAQTGTVTGVVTDGNTGETLPGANVLIQGTTTGAVTDMDGRYRFTAPAGTVTLEASFIGYEVTAQEATIVAGETVVVNFTLGQDVSLLEEFVVIGYGIQRREDATGSVSVVDTRDFNQGNITTPSELLAGKIPGVQITSAGGAPGSSATIRIRGGSSLQASNDPLIVIDGVPVDTEGIVGMRNPLSMINPNDIESFTVLKDASATAIYGSRASNGVIIITTKQGAEGAPFTVDYVGKASVSTIAQKMEVLGADQFRETINQRFADRPNVTGLLGTDNTNWQDQIYRDAYGQDHNLVMSGAVSVMPYRVSLGYSDFQGMLLNDNMERMSAAVTLNPSFLDDHLKINLNARGIQVNNMFADNGAIGGALQFDPTKPIRVSMDDPAGMFGGYFAWVDPATNLPRPVATTNPVALLELREDKSTVNRFLGSLQTDYQFHFLPDLHANLNLAYDYSETDGSIFVPDYAAWAYVEGGVDNNYTQEKKNELLDFYLNYATDINASNRIDVMAGYSWQHFWRQGSDINRNIQGNIAGTDYLEDRTSYATESYLISFFGRINYALLDRYLFTATLRNDGSSKFIGDNKWGLFPSFAFAWRIDNESFMDDVAVISQMKLRLGYGVTGQQAITANDYPALARYTYNVNGAYYQFGDDFIRTLRPEGYDASRTVPPPTRPPRCRYRRRYTRGSARY
ncbi:MAG: SusC/RagA family TonB-linked outer membrane protein [Bacteroidales bacterium]